MSYSLSPYPKFKAFYPGTGNPLSGGYLYSAQPGTTVSFGVTPAFPQTTYTDSTGGTPNSNPIVLDSNGECNLWLSTFTKLVLFDTVGNIIWSIDNVSSQPSTTASNPQWVIQSTSPTYIAPTQFSVPGNMVAYFPNGTAVQATLSGGNIVGQVTNAVYTSVTTVTVQWASTALNNTVSVIATGIISSGVPSSLPIQPVRAYTSNYTITYNDLFQYFTMSSASAASFVLPAANACPSGAWVHIKNINTGALTITATIDGLASPILNNNQERTFWTDGTSWYGSSGAAASTVSVRQTVLSGPVDSSGLPAFGGSIGSTTVTMSGTLIASAAAGFSSGAQQDVVGTGTNLSWTGLSSNGTMFLYVTVANGALTTAATTNIPNYEWGGTPSVSNNVLTFNIQAATGYIGNGSSAVATPWVCVGEVTISGNVVTVITWYALQGRHKSAEAVCAFAGSTVYSFTHNLGIIPKTGRLMLKNLTAELSYVSGDYATGMYYNNPGAYVTAFPYNFVTKGTKTTMVFAMGSIGMAIQTQSGANTTAPITNANWNYWIEAERGW